MSEYKGGCACGSVRYQSGADPSFSYLCQCRQCQKASGAGHAALFMVDEESLSLTGELRFFDQVGDSGNAIGRGFCPKLSGTETVRARPWSDSLWTVHLIAGQPGSVGHAAASAPPGSIWRADSIGGRSLRSLRPGSDTR